MRLMKPVPNGCKTCKHCFVNVPNIECRHRVARCEIFLDEKGAARFCHQIRDDECGRKWEFTDEYRSIQVKKIMGTYKEDVK